MTFESLCDIVGGTLLNQPSISAYEKIETKPHLIKRGDLFVGSEQESIAEAISNGAYAILFEGDTIMIDDEVAWIKVDSIDKALTKLLRFSLLKLDFHFFYFPQNSYDIAKQILLHNPLLFLESTIKENFHKILKADNNTTFICKDQHFLENIYPEYQSYHDTKNHALTLTHQSLFLSSFSYEEIHYEDIKLPALFLPHLYNVLQFAKEKHLQYEIEKVHFLKAFRPLFVSNRLTIKAFGDSEHAFIVHEREEEIAPALAYIQHVATWANILLFIPQHTKLLTKVPTHHYQSLQEVNQIDINKFNFILILANYNELTTILQNNKKEQIISLF